MSLITSDKLIQALADAGLYDEANTTRRIVIDLKAGEVPVIHIERFGDERMLNLVRGLEGVEIRRGAAENA